MNKLIQFAVTLVALGAMNTVTQAAEHQKPDGRLDLSGGSVAVGIGFSWGKGTLTYKGKIYDVKVDGLSLGKVGINGVSATGEVYNLKNLADFDGRYNAGAAGATIIGGKTGVAMSNQHGVKGVLTSTNRGIDLTIGGGGVKMKIKK